MGIYADSGARIGSINAGSDAVASVYQADEQIWADWNPLTVETDGIIDDLSLATRPTGITDTKVGLVVWYGVLYDFVGRFFYQNGTRFDFYPASGSRLFLRLRNAAGADIFYASFTGIHVLDVPFQAVFSWDLAATTVKGMCNGVVATDWEVTQAPVDDTVGYSSRSGFFHFSRDSANNFLTCRSAFMYFDETAYRDLDQQAVRDVLWQKGRAMDPGADGSNYWAQPLVYLDRRNGVSSYNTDKGRAGDVWTEGGAIADGGRLFK